MTAQIHSTQQAQYTMKDRGQSSFAMAATLCVCGNMARTIESLNSSGEAVAVFGSRSTCASWRKVSTLWVCRSDDARSAAVCGDWVSARWAGVSCANWSLTSRMVDSASSRRESGQPKTMTFWKGEINQDLWQHAPGSKYDAMALICTGTCTNMTNISSASTIRPPGVAGYTSPYPTYSQYHSTITITITITHSVSTNQPSNQSINQPQQINQSN